MKTCVHNNEYLLDFGPKSKCIACHSGFNRKLNEPEHRIIKSVIESEKIKKGLGTVILQTITNLTKLSVMHKNGTISRIDMLLTAVSSIVGNVESLNGECTSCVKVSYVLEVVKNIVTDISYITHTDKEVRN